MKIRYLMGSLWFLQRKLLSRDSPRVVDLVAHRKKREICARIYGYVREDEVLREIERFGVTHWYEFDIVGDQSELPQACAWNLVRHDDMIRWGGSSLRRIFWDIPSHPKSSRSFVCVRLITQVVTKASFATITRFLGEVCGIYFRRIPQVTFRVSSPFNSPHRFRMIVEIVQSLKIEYFDRRPRVVPPIRFL